ncbi:MOSC domain-containing protein [Salsipaludibacter albus]|uniref:MOSC domain-containing protein n=1 Tax=Salsipaludibacter albus TaxID=2849650 RepID=UPI001EE3D793|nr:MOSC domain-containing protein [Salsipaludibacter albus]MBY5162502.1 MOSC domain-containing protein [Salsipaludibacter albus]
MSTLTAPVDEGVVTDHLSTAELEAGLDRVAASPSGTGRVEMVVARPGAFERRVLGTGSFTAEDGLVGDDWRHRGDDPDVEAQLTLMNARFLDLVANGERTRWPWAGDQVVVDLDLSTDELVPGDRLRLGSALVEVTAKPHTGCIKFVRRFGAEAQRMVSSERGKAMRLRGIYVKVVERGEASPGDTIRVVDRD